MAVGTAHRGESELESSIRRLLARGALVVFLGNELRGDDAAGLRVGEAVAGVAGTERVVVCAEGLEMCTSRIRARKPKLILLVDAVEAGLKPGSVVLANLREEDAFHFASTHSLPKSLVLRLLGVEEVWLLGVQVGTRDVGAPLSAEVAETCEALTRILRRLLEESGKSSSPE